MELDEKKDANHLILRTKKTIETTQKSNQSNENKPNPRQKDDNKPNPRQKDDKSQILVKKMVIDQILVKRMAMFIKTMETKTIVTVTENQILNLMPL